MKGSEAIGLRMIRSGFFDMTWSNSCSAPGTSVGPWGATSATICTAPEDSSADFISSCILTITGLTGGCPRMPTLHGAGELELRFLLVVHLAHHGFNRRLPQDADLVGRRVFSLPPGQADGTTS